VVTGGPGVEVSGTGARTNPYIIDLAEVPVVASARYTTARRPLASRVEAGAQIYDTDLGLPLWSDGTVWRDAAGRRRGRR